MIVKQLEYYAPETNKDFLNNISLEKLVGGLDIKLSYNEIRINAYPGTIFYINGETVMIGETRTYNILYQENMEISSVKVNKDSFKNLDFLVITFMRGKN